MQAGAGHSSPIVVGARVYLFSRMGEQESISARDLASGKEVWRQAYDAPYQMNPAATAHGKGPKSTPVHDRGRIYTFGISGIVSAWQAQDGKLLWRKDFKKDFPSTVPEFGVAMSPIVAANLVIVHAGGVGNGAVLALDPATGETKWTWKGDGPAYASPIVATFAGTPQIVTQSQRHLVSLSLDGTPLWQIPFVTEYEQNSITPIASGDLLIYSGISQPTIAIRPALTAGKWHDGGGVAERGRADVHEHGGRIGRLAVRPHAPEPRPVLLPRRQERQDVCGRPRAGRARTPPW